MKINITFDLSKDNRIGIANYTKGHWDGDNPPADYKDCKSWIEAIIDGELSVLDFYQEKSNERQLETFDYRGVRV